MKKLLSLLAILGLAGFVIAPIYAQEEDAVALDDEAIVAEAEDVAAEEVVAEDVEAEDVAAEDDSLQQLMAENPELVTDLNAGLDEFLGALEEENEGITDEFNAQFTTDEERAAAAAGLLAIFAGFGLIAWIIAFVWWLIKTIALWKAFTKAGEAGWKAIIPIYHTYIEYKIAGMKNWFWYGLLIAFVLWLIAGFVPEQQQLFTNIACAVVWIIYIVVTFKFARKFGWGVFTSILFVLFYPICILILGFGSSKYEGKEEKTVVEA